MGLNCKCATAKDMIKLLEQDGWYMVGHKGSHRQFKHNTKKGKITVPDNITKNIELSIKRQAGLRQKGVEMNITRLLQIKQARLVRVERMQARLQAEVEYLKRKKIENHNEINENIKQLEEEIPFEDDFINDEELYATSVK